MPRGVKIALGLLVVAVIIGLISFRGIQRRVKRLAELQTADEKARHEILAAPITTSSDVTQAAKIYWAAGPDRVAPVEVPLPLSANPVERCRQLLHELTVNPPTPGQRTIPADTTVMGCLSFIRRPVRESRRRFENYHSLGVCHGFGRSRVRVRRIELQLQPWEGRALPLRHTRGKVPSIPSTTPIRRGR